MAGKFALGIDFGTESGRAALVDVSNGKEVAAAVYKYPDGVIDRVLPGTNIKLGHEWAIQNPMDYLEVLSKAVPKLLRQSGVGADDVIGIGTDFTSCTMMPTLGDGTPLCAIPKYRRNPHAWVKLWKHHAAQPEANRINEVARKRGESFLTRYGGKISSEWFFSKALQILDEAPEIYAAADRFIEGGDWIVWRMTGKETRNACAAGYKALWDREEGFPSNNYFKDLDPRFEKVVDGKMSRDILPIGATAGELTPEMAKKMKLRAGIPVAVGNIDAHVGVPATTVTSPGKMVMIMGTSTCHMLVDRKKVMVEGMCGVVADGIIPGLYGYEAGQSAVGDIFAWFVDNCVPPAYAREARRRKTDLHGILTAKAAKPRPGESGVLALDWWNGNRSILVDADLSGLLVGCTLTTPPEAIYRALIEATAFGTKKIIDSFENGGLRIRELYACGGLAQRNPFLMQIYADVTGRVIRIAASEQTGALGSAMWGAVAAGKKAGGYDTIVQAAKKMARVKRETYRPSRKNHAVYAKLYEQYEILHDYFGRDPAGVMKVLRKIRAGG